MWKLGEAVLAGGSLGGKLKLATEVRRDPSSPSSPSSTSSSSTPRSPDKRAQRRVTLRSGVDSSTLVDSSRERRRVLRNASIRAPPAAW